MNPMHYIEQSTTYQAILRQSREVGRAEGRLEEGRRLLLKLGGRKLGAPDEETRAAIEALVDLDVIEGVPGEANRPDELGGVAEPTMNAGRFQ